jgi:hypothetical protein
VGFPTGLFVGAPGRAHANANPNFTGNELQDCRPSRGGWNYFDNDSTNAYSVGQRWFIRFSAHLLKGSGKT